MKLKASIIAVLILLAGALCFAYFWYGKHTVVVEPVVMEEPVMTAPIEIATNTATTSAAAEESTPFDHHPTIKFKHSIINNGNGTNTYSSTDFGIAFEYPSEWGDKITYYIEKSECPKESKDPCLQVSALISNGNAEKKLFVVETPAHSEYYVPGRGGGWGDYASIPFKRPFGTACAILLDECNIITNKHQIDYIFKLVAPGEMYEIDARWILLFSLPNEFYKGMAISLIDPIDPENVDSTTAVKSSLIKIAESVRMVK